MQARTDVRACERESLDRDEHDGEAMGVGAMRRRPIMSPLSPVGPGAHAPALDRLQRFNLVLEDTKRRTDAAEAGHIERMRTEAEAGQRIV